VNNKQNRGFLLVDEIAALMPDDRLSLILMDYERNAVTKTFKGRKRAGFIQKIETVVKSLLSIINDILDLFKIEAENLSGDVSFVLNSVLNNLVTVIGGKVAGKGLELVIEIHPDVPVDIKGDLILYHSRVFQREPAEPKYSD